MEASGVALRVNRLPGPEIADLRMRIDDFPLPFPSPVEGGIVVTKTRFVADGQTYALANITSVKAVMIPASRNGSQSSARRHGLLRKAEPVICFKAELQSAISISRKGETELSGT